jgi:probable HAF family extracellular repeat protein
MRLFKQALTLGSFYLSASLLGISFAADTAWPRYKPVDLGTLGGSFADPVALNATGQVAGFAITNGIYSAFLYSNGSIPTSGLSGAHGVSQVPSTPAAKGPAMPPRRGTLGTTPSLTATIQ